MISEDVSSGLMFPELAAMAAMAVFVVATGTGGGALLRGEGDERLE